MRCYSAASALVGLVAMSLLPSTLAKPYPVHIDEFRDLHNASRLEKRECTVTGQKPCGYYGTLCCDPSQCYVDANNQAQCGANPATGAGGGQWQYTTKTWVETIGLSTYTSVYSTYVAAPAPTAASSQCAASEQFCGGSLCCKSGYYCQTAGTCARLGGGSSGGIFPTVTFTGSPTATVPFQTPISTGATGSLEQTQGGGGLSGGAIAGIVIGVLLAVLLLLLLCLFCCARALFDTIAAIFGFGKKRRHTHEETTFIEEHHHSGGAAGGGGRWYGQGSGRPSRPSSEKKSGVGKGFGMAAALGGLALALGMKRKHDRKDDKSTTISGSSYYYSDYTSSSSASSSDRRTRNTRQSSRR